MNRDSKEWVAMVGFNCIERKRGGREREKLKEGLGKRGRCEVVKLEE